jgi:nicotinamide riboside kinase
MKVINLFGISCSGKSTAAAGLFYEMKKMQLNVELVTEYARDLVYENRFDILSGDQIYIFAKQQRRISRLLNHKVDWVITDSPIPLSLLYLKPDVLSDHFPKLVMEVFNQYTNYNFLLHRNFAFNSVGRIPENIEESKAYDEKLTNVLSTYNIPVTTVLGGEIAAEKIINSIVLHNK